jgi:hypothetical protein
LICIVSNTSVSATPIRFAFARSTSAKSCGTLIWKLEKLGASSGVWNVRICIAFIAS